MPINITVTQKGARVETVRELTEKAIRSKYPEASVTAVRYEPPTSRAERFSEAISSLADTRSTIEELRDELQSWLDNLPEGLQGGEKAGMLEEAISNLEEIISAIEEAEGTDVEFPGMY